MQVFDPQTAQPLVGAIFRAVTGTVSKTRPGSVLIGDDEFGIGCPTDGKTVPGTDDTPFGDDGKKSNGPGSEERSGRVLSGGEVKSSISMLGRLTV